MPPVRWVGSIGTGRWIMSIQPHSYGANHCSLLPLLPQAFASSVGLVSMEQGKRARQWGACITPTVSPVTPVVRNLFLVPLAPRTPLHLCPRLMGHPALAQAGVWKRLSKLWPLSLWACVVQVAQVPEKICWALGREAWSQGGALC